MTSEADRIEGLIKQRIERKQYRRQRRLGLGGLYFSPLQLPGSSQSVGREYQRNDWAVGEFLEYYDRQFVQNAYLVLLKRDADLEGLNHRLQGLHTAEWSRLELLFRLRYGPEGKQHKVRVSGLLRAFALERFCAVPVVGLIPSYVRALLRLPRMQRDVEELRGLIAMQKNDSDDKARAIVDFQNEELTKIIRHLGN
jgi:hypothetical protein